MAAPAVANQFVSYGTKRAPKPRPFEPERVGHPEELRQLLSVDVLEWYHPFVRISQQEKRERVGHPTLAIGDAI